MEKKLNGPLLKYWPFGNKWSQLSSYWEHIKINNFEEFQTKMEWSINNREFPHACKSVLCEL